MSSHVLRTLVVDSSLVFRKIISDLLLEIEGVELAGQAPNGKIALNKILDLRPDLVILEMNLQDMSGLEVLRQIREFKCDCRVIVLSGASPNMSLLTMKALSAGAFEFVLKPAAETIEDTKQLLKSEFKLAVQALIESLRIHRSMDIAGTSGSSGLAKKAAVDNIPAGVSVDHSRHSASDKRVDLIVIGISTGGPPALAEVFSAIREPLRVPVVIVQHIPQFFSEALATSIRERSGLWVEEARDGMLLEPGHVYLAPGGGHLKIVRGSNAGSHVLRLTHDKPENNCRPSIDYLLRSVAANFSGRVGLFIMTGMGTDGLAGARLIRSAGGYIVAQDAQSCVVYGMPRAVVEAELADEVLSLGAIASAIQRLSRQAS
ncbi:MAG: chemotaxis response regulator protein-glutamate methylesterase [Candidatus Riflebacteria bacterium HGW-Riflebacteria-2]|jgi:two-component system chemotaxis response regulator CheB|nr:MAG: chemotaxis response regulator protein-glutamate methylesterase [Candidatus Riflebacteria bacterium HGW-Riflebacteria-2]